VRHKRLIVAGLVVAAASAAWLLEHRRAVPARVALPAPPAAPGGDIVLTARLRARHVVPVPVPVQGTVERLDVDAGQEVYEGQVLGRIKNGSLRAEADSAAADLAGIKARVAELQSQLLAARFEASRARSDANHARAESDRADRASERQQMLFREGATPRLVYEKAVREAEAARQVRDNAAQVAQAAEERLNSVNKLLDAARRTLDDKNDEADRTTDAAASADIRSPVTGLVVGRTKRVDDEVTPEDGDIFQIAVDPAALEAVATAEPVVLGRIRIDQDVLVTLVEAADPVPAKVSDVKSGEVIVQFTAPNPAVKPGGTAELRIRAE